MAPRHDVPGRARLHLKPLKISDFNLLGECYSGFGWRKGSLPVARVARPPLKRMPVKPPRSGSSLPLDAAPA
jgi:hypothetical protein